MAFDTVGRIGDDVYSFLDFLSKRQGPNDSTNPPPEGTVPQLGQQPLPPDALLPFQKPVPVSSRPVQVAQVGGTPAPAPAPAPDAPKPAPIPQSDPGALPPGSPPKPLPSGFGDPGGSIPIFDPNTGKIDIMGIIARQQEEARRRAAWDAIIRGGMMIARGASRDPNGAPAPAVALRPLRSGDAAAVVAVFRGMGARSRALRFLVPKSRLTLSDVRHLVEVDQRDHVALLASTVPGRRPVAIGRFIRDRGDPGSAEVALEVVDAWQGRGVGTVLLEELVRQAREVGVRRFTMIVSDDNRAVRRLLHRAGARVSRVGAERGTTEYAVSLDEVPR